MDKWETLGEVRWCAARLTKKCRCIEMVLKLTCDSDDTVLSNMSVLSQVHCRLQDSGGGKLLR